MTTPARRHPSLLQRILAYVAAMAAAATIFVIWFMVWNTITDEQLGIHVSAQFTFGFALVFMVINGFLPALCLLALPWILVITIFPLIRFAGWIYFIASGAILLTLLACATTSLAPEPLFIEDQTFTQTYVIAIQRQGLCFLIAGAVFGLTYWMIAGAKQRANPAPARRPAEPGGGGTVQ